MTWTALRSLAERRARAALTALAVVLGVAMIAGSLILTDTIDRAFTNIFASNYENTDLVVHGTSVVPGSRAGAPQVPAELLPRIAALPGVAEAGGGIVDVADEGNTAKIIGRDGDAIGGNAPTLGLGLDPAHPRFNPLELVSGDWASGGDQVVLDAATADGHDFAVGDTVRISGTAGIREFTVTGTATYGGVESLGGATIAAFDVPTARAVLGTTGFDAIQIALAPGASADAVAGEIAALLPDSAQVATGEEQASSDKSSVSEFITFIRAFLLAFGGIALFVGAFVILNTMSITVAQRTRELATLRTLGASRRQVLRSVLAEAALIGVAASAAGLALGVGLARGLSALFGSLGLSLPEGPTVVAGSTVVASLLAGTLVTVAAGLVPAIRATRVAPIAAVREGAAIPQGGTGRRGPVLALLSGGVAAALIARGVVTDGLATSDRLLAMAAGGLFLIVGVALVASRLVRPIAAIAGWPLARTGASGSLARDNAVRNPSRTAATAAALMVGLALVTFVAMLGSSLIDTARSDVREELTAERIVTSGNAWDLVPSAAGRAVAAAAPDEAIVSSVREDQALVDGSSTFVSGVDPATIADVHHFSWTAGPRDAAAALAGDGAIVDRPFADDHDLTVGSPVSLTTPSGTTVTRTVTAIHEPPRLAPLLGRVIIPTAAFDAAFPRHDDRYTFVSGADPDRIAAVLAPWPDAKVVDVAELADDVTADVASILNLLYVLLALSVVVSVFGMVNTMVLAVHERTREIGMLRAVGMSRRQVRRMVRGESVVTALIGAALGIPLGIGMAALVTAALSEWGVTMTIPLGSLLAFAGVAVAVGVVAAVAPARRASRLDVLQALQYE